MRYIMPARLALGTNGDELNRSLINPIPLETQLLNQSSDMLGKYDGDSKGGGPETQWW